LQDLRARVDHLAALNTASITFTGGEPLLHPELDQIIRAARNHGMIVTMITNGFRLSRDWIERLTRRICRACRSASTTSYPMTSR